MNYHDLEHLSPPFPRLGEEVAIFLETEAQEGLLLYEKDGEVLQKPMARVPGGLKAQVAVAQSPFRYLFRLPEGYWGSHGLEKALPRYDRFFHLLARSPSPGVGPGHGLLPDLSRPLPPGAKGPGPPGRGLALRG
jgi:alpha-glucosidase